MIQAAQRVDLRPTFNSKPLLVLATPDQREQSEGQMGRSHQQPYNHRSKEDNTEWAESGHGTPSSNRPPSGRAKGIENGSKITHPARANIVTQGKALSNGNTQQVLGRKLLIMNAVPQTHNSL
jgi:hypothetical protein